MAFYEFEIGRNRYLKQDTTGYYSIDFESYGRSGKLSFLHTLKNTRLDVAENDLIKAKK